VLAAHSPTGSDHPPWPATRRIARAEPYCARPLGRRQTADIDEGVRSIAHLSGLGDEFVGPALQDLRSRRQFPRPGRRPCGSAARAAVASGVGLFRTPPAETPEFLAHHGEQPFERWKMSRQPGQGGLARQAQTLTTSMTGSIASSGADALEHFLDLAENPTAIQAACRNRRRASSSRRAKASSWARFE